MGTMVDHNHKIGEIFVYKPRVQRFFQFEIFIYDLVGASFELICYGSTPIVNSLRGPSLYVRI